MSKPAYKAISIPARVTAQQLADVIGRDVTEVQAVLTDREELAASGAILSSSLANINTTLASVETTMTRIRICAVVDDVEASRTATHYRT